jgi:hypothetical protein
MKLIALSQMAKDLGYHKYSLRRFIHLGYIKAEKLGNYWVVTQKEYDRIKARRIKMGRLPQE